MERWEKEIFLVAENQVSEISKIVSGKKFITEKYNYDIVWK